jgi:hypothetical protein
VIRPHPGVDVRTAPYAIALPQQMSSFVPAPQL